MFTKIKIKIENFFRKYKRIIIIAVLIWLIIFGINKLIGAIQDAQPPTVSYNPKTPVVSGSNVPKNTYNNTEDIINKYIDFCNEKNYEEAYNLITDACKEVKFENNIEQFKAYVNYIFEGKKVASIQSYSNKDNIYIYKVAISEDIMATGRNSDYKTYNEMVVAYKEDLTKISLGGFIKKEKLDYMNQDDYLRIWLEEKNIYYDKVTYKVKIKNLGVYPIVIANQKDENEVLLSLQGDNRNMLYDNYSNRDIISYAGGTKEFNITFNKYYDESRKESAITFNKIRILEDYSGIEENWEQEISKAVKKYSIEIPLQ